MKKSLIAGAGVSALAFAALPFAGVLAASPTSFTDHLSVVVEGGCTIETSATGTDGSYQDRNLGATIPAGTWAILNDGAQTPTQGATMTVSCNGTDATKNWQVTITPPTSGNLTATGTSDFIAPGLAESGSSSVWAIQSNAAGGTFNSNNWETYAAAPSSETVFLKGSLASGNSGTFKPTYKVYVAPDLDPGTYTGDVIYSVSLVNPQP